MTHRRTSLVIALALVSAAMLGACSSDDRIVASATFDDVADLAPGAPVMMADRPIGQVRSIQLDATGRRATVRFAVDPSAQVPAEVTARVRRTTPLGEKFIDLVPETDDLDAPLLADGATVERTRVVADLEQFIESGTDAFGALSASQLAILLDEGDRAFGGKGPQLSLLLTRLSEVTAGYADRTDELVSIIESLDELAGDLAPRTEENGRALVELSETLAILNEQDEEFFALVRSLNQVAEDGDRILDRHLEQIGTQIRGLREVTDAVASEQQALGLLLVNLHRHNETVPLAERANFVHVLLDVVLCGIPGGGDVPGDPVDACYPGEGG